MTPGGKAAFPRKAAALLLYLLPWLLLLWNTGSVWDGPEPLLKNRVYFWNALLFWLIALEMVWLGFTLRQRRARLASALLAGAALVWTWGLADLTVLLAVAQSVGPGGGYCLSHRNWHLRNVHENSLGYWDAPVGPAPVVAIGDSFTWGQGVHAGERFTDYLASRLGVRVVNFGLPGSGTRDQIRIMLPHLDQVKPRLVLLCYLANDIHDGVQLFEPTVWQPAPGTRALIRFSPTLNWAYFKFFGGLSNAGSAQRYTFTILSNYLDERVMREHGEDLKKLADGVRARGAQPVAVILPFTQLFDGVRPALRERIYRSIRQGFQAANVPLIELQELEKRYPPGRFEVNSQDGHPSPEVHRALADGIAGWLQEHPELWKP